MMKYLAPPRNFSNIDARPTMNPENSTRPQNGPNNPNNTIICQLCDIPGHSALQCNVQRPPQRRTNNGACFICNETTHWANTCPSRRNMNQSRNRTIREPNPRQRDDIFRSQNMRNPLTQQRMNQSRPRYLTGGNTTPLGPPRTWRQHNVSGVEICRGNHRPSHHIHNSNISENFPLAQAIQKLPKMPRTHCIDQGMTISIRVGNKLATFLVDTGSSLDGIDVAFMRELLVTQPTE